MDKASFLEFIGQFGLFRWTAGRGDWIVPPVVAAAAYDSWEASRSLGPVIVYERVLVFLGGDAGRGVYENAYLDWMQDVLDGRMYWQADEILTPQEIQRIENLIAEHRSRNAAREAVRLRRRQAGRVLSDPVLRRRVFERDGYQCRSCSSPELLSVDHIVAVISGGTDDIENLQTLCRACNSSKGRREPAAWQPRRRRGKKEAAQ